VLTVHAPALHVPGAPQLSAAAIAGGLQPCVHCVLCRELGAIFCAAEAPAGSSSSSRDAKQQMQAAYEAVMARQMAAQDAADLQ
jgi:hypothetical protein